MGDRAGMSDGAGIGVVFEVGNDGSLYLKELVPGQAAHGCGKLKEGDALVAVDGVDVMQHSIEQVSQLIFGKRGESVRLVFQRVVNLSDTPESRSLVQFEITLRRGLTDSSAPMHIKGVAAVSDHGSNVPPMIETPSSSSRSQGIGGNTNKEASSSMPGPNRPGVNSNSAMNLAGSMANDDRDKTFSDTVDVDAVSSGINTLSGQSSAYNLRSVDQQIVRESLARLERELQSALSGQARMASSTAAKLEGPMAAAHRRLDRCDLLLQENHALLRQLHDVFGRNDDPQLLLTGEKLV